MALVAGAIGQKSTLTDDAIVDHLSEKTVGHGVRVKGISDPSAYPVQAGDIGEMFGTSRAGTGGNSYSVRTTTAYTGSLAPLISINLNKGVYLVSYNCGGYLAAGGPTSSEAYLYVGGVAVTNIVRAYTTTYGISGMNDVVPVVITADSTSVAVYGYVNGGLTVNAPVQELRIIRIA